MRAAENDPDFMTFVGIASETDNFPVGDLRERWHPETLPALDAEREKAEAHYMKGAVEAAKRLFSRYEHA